MSDRAWTLRNAGSPQDWEQILALLVSIYVDEGFSDPQSAQQLFCRSSLENQGDLLVAADTEGKILGVILLLKERSNLCQVAENGEAEFRLLGVDPVARGQRIGRGLVVECLRRANRRGAHRMVLSTQPSMCAAQALYDRLGFTRQVHRGWQTPSGGARWVYSIELKATI